MRVTKQSNAEYFQKPRPFTLKNDVTFKPFHIGLPQHLTRVGLELKKQKFSESEIAKQMTSYGKGIIDLPYKGRYALTEIAIERCISNVLSTTEKAFRFKTSEIINVLDGAINHSFYNDTWNPGLRFLFSAIVSEYILLSGNTFPLGFWELVRRTNMGWVTAQQYFQVLYHNSKIFILFKARLGNNTNSHQYKVVSEEFFKITRSKDKDIKILHPDLAHLVDIDF